MTQTMYFTHGGYNVSLCVMDAERGFFPFKGVCHFIPPFKDMKERCAIVRGSNPTDMVKKAKIALEHLLASARKPRVIR